MSPFFPAPEDSSLARRPGIAKPAPGGSEIHEPKFRRAAIAFRIFRPEFPANVESREGCPCRICFHGMHGNAVTASGPWRTSGDWWEEHGWRQDEWDVEILFDSSGYTQASHRDAQNGLYRIYYDRMRRGWFVRGRYD